MSRRNRRLLLDLILSILLVFEMLYSLTGNTLHEAIGFLLLVGVAIHLILSRKWIASTARALTSGSRQPVGRHGSTRAPKLTTRRKCLAFVAALLLLDATLLAVSSLTISTTLSGWGLGLWKLNASGVWTIVHHASAYGLCAITIVHLAMHWTLLTRPLNVDYDPGRRRAIGYAVGATAALGTFAFMRIGLANTVEALEPNAPDADDGKAENTTSKAEKDATAETTSQPTAEEGPQPHEEYEYEEYEYEEPAEEPTYAEELTYVEEPTYAEGPEPVGNCPLCHNHCPLSAPSCNRPYEAGLV